MKTLKLVVFAVLLVGAIVLGFGPSKVHASQPKQCCVILGDGGPILCGPQYCPR